MSEQTALRTIAKIDDPEDLLDDYCSPDSGHPWPLYDIDPAPDVLSGPDLCAPALLSYPVPGAHLNAMSNRGSGEARLLAAMRSILAYPDGPVFWRLPEADLDWLCDRDRGGPVPNNQFGAFVHALDLVQGIKGLSSVFVTKTLHRKRPNQVPLKDSLVCKFYGIDDENYAELFRAVHKDVNVNHELLRDLALHAQRHATRPMSPLRALDIVVWMHMKENEVAN